MAARHSSTLLAQRLTQFLNFLRPQELAMAATASKSTLQVPSPSSNSISNLPTPQMSPVREEVIIFSEAAKTHKPHIIVSQKARDLPLEFKEPSLSDLDEIHRLEALSYPEDEAASKKTLEYRIQNALPYFLIGVSKDTKEIMGFVCGTASALDELKHSTMFTHVPDGTTLNIHSVVCNPEFRRKGVATAVLQALIEKIKADQKIKLVCLICKADLIQLYEQNGFDLIGPSTVVHGKEQWFEMRLRIRD